MQKSVDMALRGKKKGELWRRIRRDKFLLLMLLPCFVFLVVFKYVPMYGVTLAFRDTTMGNVLQGEWVGLKYFEFFFKYFDAWKLIRNTLLLNVYSILLFPLPIVLAFLFNELQRKRFQKTVSLVSYVPYFISTTVVVGIMVQALSPTTGWVNKIIMAFGGDAVYFLIKPEWFRFLFLFSGYWQTLGWSTIIYVAALSAVDTQLYEAAIIDGAGRWRQMLHVTLPSISGIVILSLIMSFGGILSTNTEKALLMQNDLNMSTSDVLGTFLYRVGLRESNYSLGAAIGFMNSVASAILIIIVNQIARSLSDTSLF